MAVGFLCVVLPWANRENPWVRATLVLFSLVMTWNYLLWRFTTLPQYRFRGLGVWCRLSRYRTSDRNWWYRNVDPANAQVFAIGDCLRQICRGSCRRDRSSTS